MNQDLNQENGTNNVPSQKVVPPDNLINSIPGLDLGSFLRFIKVPEDTQAILDIQKSMLTAPRRNEMIQWVLQALDAELEFKKLFEERYDPNFPKNSTLIAMAPGSLGHAIGLHLVSNGIEIDFAGLDISMFSLKDANLLSYLSHRGIKIHDVVHTVLGLGISAMEEYAVASYTLAQFRSPYHMVLVCSGYLSTAFERPHEIPKFLDIIHRYYNLGLNSKFIMAYRYEDNLSKNLSEVRAELGLPAGLP